MYPHKRHVAAVGFDRDEMTLSPITYDEMRPGCYEPKARLADMDVNHVEASLVVPDLPALLRPDVPRGQGPGARACACVQAYNDWMVEEWCGDSDGRLIPLYHHPAVGRRRRRRRGAAQRRPRRARRLLQRDPAAPRPAEHPHRLLGPVLRGVRTRPSTVVCMHIGSSSKMPATSPDAPPAVQATLSRSTTRWRRCRDFLFSGVLVRFPDAEAGLLRGPDRLAPLHARAGRRRVGGAPGLGRRARPRPRAAVDLLLPPGLRLLLPRPARPRRRSTRSASTTSPSRPTTRTPTRPGPTPRRSPRT